MSDDYDKQQWQAEQSARDAAIEKEREKHRKARERSARNARRKLERLHRTLSEKGEISAFEDEFAESVSERLDEFGSAFADPQLGRPGDALSSAQKRVVARMNRKVKDLKKRPVPAPGDAKAIDPAADDDFVEELQRPRYDTTKQGPLSRPSARRPGRRASGSWTIISRMTRRSRPSRKSPPRRRRPSSRPSANHFCGS